MTLSASIFVFGAGSERRFFDLWNNEILSHSLSAKRGDRMTYISGLNDLIKLKEDYPEYKMILHSDQGSVYASKNYNDLLGPCGIIHSIKIGHLNCIFSHTICHYCTAAYVSLYCLGVRYPSEYAGRSSLKNFIYAAISSSIFSPRR